MNVQPGMLATKVGMTQIFRKDGTRVPVTVLSVKGNRVVAHRTLERDGYTALQIGFFDQKASRKTKAELGHFKKAGVDPTRFVKEFRVQADALAKYPVGSELPIDMFVEGAIVDVTSRSKGKGFQGVMKRHHMKGKPNTHGTHEYFRHGGSIGCRLTPGRVHPGKRMGGHMGDVIQTVQNLEIAGVMAAEGVLLVKGPVPGSVGTLVRLRPSLKTAIRAAAKA